MRGHDDAQTWSMSGLEMHVVESMTQVHLEQVGRAAAGVGMAQSVWNSRQCAAKLHHFGHREGFSGSVDIEPGMINHDAWLPIALGDNTHG